MTSETLLVGDDKGRVCIYRSGSLINVKTVFSSPVVSLQESEEVVMLSTYSAIVIWSKTTVLDIIANQNIEEMQVRIKFVLELYPKFLSEKFLSIDGSFIVREKYQKVLSYKIGWFLPSKTKVLKQQMLELFSLQFYRELCVQLPLQCHSYVDWQWYQDEEMAESVFMTSLLPLTIRRSPDYFQNNHPQKN